MTTENFIITVIYSISLMSALFCLWVKWYQDDLSEKMQTIEKHYEEIKKSLVKIEKELERLNLQNPFKKTGR